MTKPSRYSTTTEAEIRACVEQGMKFPAIAEKLNVNLTMLRQAACLLGIKSPKKPMGERRSYYVRKNPKRDPQEMAALVGSHTLQQIADLFGYKHRSGPLNALKRAGLSTKPERAA